VNPLPARRFRERVRAAVSIALAMSLAMLAIRTSRTETPHVRPDPVDVNAAGPDELALLPRVGPSLAAAIVADRDARGPFRAIADLDRVRGIGPATLDGLRPHVTVGRAYAAR
jgi:competence ComEA-like helix-hairpin-helix protein